MELELATFKVDRVELGNQTALRGQTLIVDREAIRSFFVHDPAVLTLGSIASRT
jgi:hypothetical protein